MLNSHFTDQNNPKNDVPGDVASPVSGHTVNYFKNEWVEKQVEADSSSTLKTPIIVFAMKDQPVTIDPQNIQARDIATVYPGTEYKHIGENRYEINPYSHDELLKLFEELKARGFLPKQLVYLWTMDDAGLNEGKLAEMAKGQASLLDMAESCLSIGAYYIFNILKCILQLKMKNISKVLMFHGNSKGLPNPFYEMLGSYGRSLGYVLPELAFSTIQISGDSPVDKAVFDELRSEEHEKEVLYKENKRYIKKFKIIDLDKSNSVEFKKGAAYLITGGAGGLGLLFARYLVEKYQANLILVGRSELDAKRQSTIDELEKSGSKVIYLNADVADISQMEKVIKTSKEVFGHINGIIHAAGLLSEKLIPQKNLDEFKAIIQSKIIGTIVLDELTKAEPVELMVLFSSTSSTIGDFGQCDYSLGNRFLDCYTQFRDDLRKRNGRSGKTIAINWPLWEEGGMHQNKETESLYLQASGMGYLQNHDGIRAFEDIISSNEEQVMVMYGNTERIKASLGMGERQPAKVQNEGTDKKSATPDFGVPPVFELKKGESVEQIFEQDLQKLAAEILKISAGQLDPTVNLGNFGFDSISLKVYADKISEKYGIEVSPTVFFASNTIRSLSESLIGENQDKIRSCYSISDTSNKVENAPAQTVLTKQSSYLEPLKNRLPGLNRFGKDTMGIKGSTHYEPIAVIGMDGIFPGSKDLDAYWANLEAAADLITQVPPSRWDWREYYSEDPQAKNKSISKCGGFIEDADKFDAQFFSISPVEAEFMDPQHRLLLQTVWKATEDAGYKASDLAGRNIGVFVGVQFNDYQELIHASGETKPQMATGNSHAVLANRISYFLNLRGPSESIDTACSGSLVAIHRAIQSIQRGETEMAFAGGVSLMLSPQTTVSASKLGILSPDNRCKTFDKSANGYVRGEGIGVLLLKPLSKAIRDNDHIHAVIRGSAENHGGRANSLTAPNPDAQAAVLTRAYQEAGIPPNTITYIEAHGTGTELGDPVEINGIKKAFKELYKIHRIPVPEGAYCGIGSVKTNIGHLEPAAGIAGISKVILALKNGKLPATVNFKELNPYIDINNSPFYIVTKTKNWDRLKDKKGNSIPRRAGVSSFGFGGSNAHIVLEEYNQANTDVSTEEPQIIVLSAKNSERLKEYAKDLLEFLNKKQSFTRAFSLDKQVQNDLVQIAAKITNIDPPFFNTDENLEEYGFDKYKYLELVQAVITKFGIEVESDELNGKSSINAMAEYLSESFNDCLREYYKDGLEDCIEQVEEYNVGDIAYTLQLGRESMDERLAMVAKNVQDLRECLHNYLSGNTGNDVFADNVKNTKNKLDIFDNDEDANTMINEWINKKKLSKIARLWVTGYEINWSMLHQDCKRHRISLPTYPFSKERYWISAPSGSSGINNQKGLGSLLDSVEYDLSMDTGVVFYKHVDNQPSILRDHVIGGQNIFPGVGYLEMAYQAAAVIKGDTEFQICRVYWMYPLIVGKEEQKVLISLKKEGQKFLFEVKGSAKESKAMIYAKGEIHDRVNDGQSFQSISVDEIKDRCTQTIRSEEIYQRYEAKGVDYGPFFRGITEVYKNDDEALGVLNLSSDSGPGLNYYTLHPTLMDSALQIIGCIKEAGQKPFLPFSVERVELLHPLQQKMYTYVRASGQNSFNVAIIDEQGRVCVKFYNFTLREAKDKFDDLYYRPVWRKKPLTAERAGMGEQLHNQSDNGTALIIYSDDGQDAGRASLAGMASLAGIASLVDRICTKYSKALKLKLGSANIKHSDELWEIKADGTSADDVSVDAPSAIDTFISDLTEVDTIYFLSGIQSGSIDLNDFDALNRTQQKGVISLFRLIKALENKGFLQNPLNLKIMTNNIYPIDNSPVVLPAAASIHGFLKSLSKEYPKLNVTVLDIDLLGFGSELTAEKIDSLVKPLFYEPSHPDGETIVYRNGERYERIMEPVRLSESGESAFKENGVYLIIGGAGGIGLELGRYLAKKVKARLFLVGRSELSNDKKAALKEIEELGGTVIYHQADITNEQSMTNAIQEAKSKFGAINGVFHSAIVSADKTIRSMTESDLIVSLAPKVIGSAVLYSVLHNEKLDFLAFFSSTSSLVGMPGQSNYVSGLNFKDAFASYIGKETSYPVKIFNWGFWGIGSGEGEDYIKRLRTQGIYTISIEEGMETIERVLKNSENQVFILKADRRVFERLGIHSKEEHIEKKEIVQSTKAPLALATPNRTVMSDSSQGTQEERLSDFLKTAFSRILKMDKEKMDNQTDLEQFGVDSLLGLEIHANLEKSFGDLPATLLLENTNFAGLINYFLNNHQEKLDSILGRNVVKANTVDLFESNTAPDQEVTEKETVHIGLSQEKTPEIEPPIDLQSFMVEIDSNTRVEVSSMGTGAPILLIPGFAVTALLNSYQIRDWSAKYRVITINLPGHGRSDAIEDLSFSGISKMMLKVIDKLGVSEPLHVVGGSFGGMVAQSFAREFPDRVKTLSLMGSFTVSKFEGVSQYFSFVETVAKDFERVKETTLSQEIRDNVDYNFSLYKMSQASNRSLMVKYLDLMKLGMTTRDILHEIKAPTMVMVGAIDSVVDPEESRILHSNIKNSKYIEIPDGGHFINLTHNDMVDNTIMEFMAEHENQSK